MKIRCGAAPATAPIYAHCDSIERVAELHHVVDVCGIAGFAHFACPVAETYGVVAGVPESGSDVRAAMDATWHVASIASTGTVIHPERLRANIRKAHRISPR
jgi:hypothetical protein